MLNRIGSRGPAPTPSALKAKYGIGLPLPNEPKPNQVPPPKPETLEGDASKEWDRLVAILFPLGLLTEIDGNALERYCVMYAQFRQTAKLLSKSQILIVGEKGNLVRNPAIMVLKDLEKGMKELEREFGMTPSSRTRITVPININNQNGGVFAGMKQIESAEIRPALPDIEQEGDNDGSTEESTDE